MSESVYLFRTVAVFAYFCGRHKNNLGLQIRRSFTFKLANLKNNVSRHNITEFCRSKSLYNTPKQSLKFLSFANFLLVCDFIL